MGSRGKDDRNLEWVVNRHMVESPKKNTSKGCWWWVFVRFVNSIFQKGKTSIGFGCHGIGTGNILGGNCGNTTAAAGRRRYRIVCCIRDGGSCIILDTMSRIIFHTTTVVDTTKQNKRGGSVSFSY